MKGWSLYSLLPYIAQASYSFKFSFNKIYWAFLYARPYVKVDESQKWNKTAFLGCARLGKDIKHSNPQITM